MQVVLQRVVGDELVDEEAVVLGDAVADEGDEVAVVDAADDVHLRAEFLLPLPPAHLELLHGHAPPVAQRAHVHLPEPALADHVRRREPARDPRQLFVREARLGPRVLVRARVRRRDICMPDYMLDDLGPGDQLNCLSNRRTLTCRHDDGFLTHGWTPLLPPVADAHHHEKRGQCLEEPCHGDTDDHPDRQVVCRRVSS